jgi:C4-dicarboxylate-specific signal transduction histidine kinase
MKNANIGADENQIQNLPADRLLAVLIEQSKASTIGSLVKGIVHNLNGSLQILSMRMEMLQRFLVQERGNTGQAAREQVEQCLGQIDQFRGLIEGLMGKSVQDEQAGLEPIRINDLLEESLVLLYHNLFFKHQVKVVKKLSPTLPSLRVRYSDLSQGLWNILQNAVEAMEKSPTKELTLTTSTDDNQIRIDIQDTGCGISETIKDALFQPFITTKTGKHPGLGLFIAQQLLRPYGASFAFSSREGETILAVYLPASVARGN